MAEKRLDLTGEVCPFSLLKTQAALEQMSKNDVLLVETDFNQSVRNIMKWCENQGYSFILDELEDGLWLITISRC